jgi:hypothetical protein
LLRSSGFCSAFNGNWWPKMPAEWIDKDTHHKIVKLSSGLEGNSLSFYFHNNPFIGNEMIFYNSSKQTRLKLPI